MQEITNSDLEMFKERSMTGLPSIDTMTRLAYDIVVPMLCDEVLALRKQLAAKDEALKECMDFLGETIQCGVEGEMLDGRHVNVAASDLADKVDDVLNIKALDE